MKERILVVDDEPKITEIVQAYLEKEGYQVLVAHDGKRALEIFEQNQPDFIILDLMLPGISGEEVCRQIRQTSHVPILMLTAKSAEESKIKGLNIGADDYLVKPFSPRELVARVKAIQRRSNFQGNSASVLIYGDGELKIYPEEMRVLKDDREVDLTSTEFKLLLVMVQNPGQVFSREQLAERVMGLEFKGFDRTIDTHIKNIRKKLDIDKDRYIYTVYGAGYKFMGE
ncbi:MAG: hypothetical protein PWR10_1484 [Halanaerobiales bacterium]|nr:hypothetical protein [Halanaerobiales bacterium]